MVVVAKYFKVNLNYGHQGAGKRHESNRYLRMGSNASYIDVMDLAQGMPGVKKGMKACNEIVEISREEYLKGKKRKEEDFFIKQLKNPALRH